MNLMDMNILIIVISLQLLIKIHCESVHQNGTFTPRLANVIGGELAKIKDFPFLVSLHYRVRRNSNGHRCCGFLLTPSWICTAAHCLIDIKEPRNILPTRDYFVLAGTTNVIHRDGSHQKRYPAKFIPHPNFDFSVLYNDIGLIRVHKPFVYKGDIGLALLPKGNYQLEPWTTCIAAGWGITDKSNLNSKSDELRSVKLHIVPMSSCEKATGGSFFLNPAGSVCTISFVANEDVCKGDSGSSLLCELPMVEGEVLDPVMVKDWAGAGWSLEKEKHHKVVGIVSWSWECAEAGVPALFTDIKNYRLWLLNTILNDNSSRTEVSLKTTFICLSLCILLRF